MNADASDWEPPRRIRKQEWRKILPYPAVSLRGHEVGSPLGKIFNE
jgi:hypothetical protein